MVSVLNVELTTLKQGLQEGELLATQTEWRQPPANLTAADYTLFSHEFERQFDACSVMALDELSMLGPSWWQWRYQRLVDAYCPGHGPRRRWRDRLRDLAGLRRPARCLNEAIWAHDDLSGNYFHWLTDVLPKLQAWQETSLPCRTLLLPATLLQRGYVGESLLRLGFAAESFDAPARLEISRLWVIGATAPTGNFRAALLQRLCTALLGSTPAVSVPARCIYISRADAKQRFLRNEAELFPLLAVHGLEIVQLEGRSLAEQIDLFRACRLLVGLHGAGLTNMLWMPLGSRVIEIRRRGDNHNNCYFAMASALGHTYSYLQADDQIPNHDTHTAELRLSPEALQQLLQSATEGLRC